MNPTNFKAMIHDSASSNKKVDLFGKTKKSSLDKEIEALHF